MEDVLVGAPVQRVGQERREVQEHDRADEHAQQRERAQADLAAEQLVEPGDQRRRRLRGAARPARSSRTASRPAAEDLDPRRVGVVPGVTRASR